MESLISSNCLETFYTFYSRSLAFMMELSLMNSLSWWTKSSRSSNVWDSPYYATCNNLSRSVYTSNPFLSLGHYLVNLPISLMVRPTSSFKNADLNAVALRTPIIMDNYFLLFYPRSWCPTTRIIPRDIVGSYDNSRNAWCVPLYPSRMSTRNPQCYRHHPRGPKTKRIGVVW